MRHSARLPSRSEVKTITRPSGVTLGQLSAPGAVVSCERFSPSVSMIQMSVLPPADDV